MCGTSGVPDSLVCATGITKQFAAALAMSNAKQTRVCGNRMCGQAFVAGPRYKASWCLPCKNWLARHGDIRNPNY